ncbi:MAG: hypothetical protein IPG04_16935 [Polyangiaceae bacterium]|nr:hypothetical protein [Polyangiaceae bacterium]
MFTMTTPLRELALVLRAGGGLRGRSEKHSAVAHKHPLGLGEAELVADRWKLPSDRHVEVHAKHGELMNVMSTVSLGLGMDDETVRPRSSLRIDELNEKPNVARHRRLS